MTTAAVYPLSSATAATAALPMLTAIDPNQALGTIGLVVAIMITLAAGYYTVKTKRAEVWRETADAYKAQADERAAKLEQMLSLLHEKDIQIAKLEARPNLDGVASQLAEAFRTNSIEHRQMITALEQIAASSGGRRADDPT